MTKPMYSRHSPGMYSIWCDWETTGADFEGGLEGTFKKYQGISLGVIIANNETYEEIDNLYLEFKFDNSKYEWTEGAEKIHGLTREYLEANGLTRQEGLESLIEFLSLYFGDNIISLKPETPTSKVCFGGHNVQFDIAATGQLFSDFGFNLGVHHVVLDTTALAFVAIGEYKSDVVFEFFGGEKRGKHNALDDARMALSVARGIKQLVQASLS